MEDPLVIMHLTCVFHAETGWTSIHGRVSEVGRFEDNRDARTHFVKFIELPYDEDHRAAARGMFEEYCRHWLSLADRASAF